MAFKKKFYLLFDHKKFFPLVEMTLRGDGQRWGHKNSTSMRHPEPAFW